MSNIVLYGIDLSAPVRACLLTLKALDLPFEYKIVQLMKGEHLTEEFLKHNPQHTVPVLDDDGTWIWDSHAICAYLVDKYAGNDELYPKDLAQRAVVNQRMFFDASILYMSMRAISKPFFHQRITVVPKEKVVNVLEGYTHLENFLGDNTYLTGESLTIADFCCLATASSLAGIIPLDEEKYPKTAAWLARLSELPYYGEANDKGAKQFIGLLKSNLTKIEMD